MTDPNQLPNPNRPQHNLLKAAISAGAAVLAAGTVMVARHNDTPEPRSSYDHPSPDDIRVVPEIPADNRPFKPAPSSDSASEASDTAVPRVIYTENVDTGAQQAARPTNKKSNEPARDEALEETTPQGLPVETPKIVNEEHADPLEDGDAEEPQSSHTTPAYREPVKPIEQAPVIEKSPYELAAAKYSEEFPRDDVARTGVNGFVQFPNNKDTDVNLIEKAGFKHYPEYDMAVFAFRDNRSMGYENNLVVHPVKTTDLVHYKIYGNNEQTPPSIADFSGALAPQTETSDAFVTADGTAFGRILPQEVTIPSGTAYHIEIVDGTPAFVQENTPLDGGAETTITQP